MAAQAKQETTVMQTTEQAVEKAQISDRTIADTVLSRIKAMETDQGLQVPPNYSVTNALKSAWLTILKTVDMNKRPALDVCTKESVANSLLDMVIQGLTPAKTQCYFIVYGNQLTMMRSYFGTASVLKRLTGVDDVFAQVIYADDEFEYEIRNGYKVITKHNQKMANIDNSKIVGAYAVISKNGFGFAEVMTKAQIDVSWSKRKNSGQVQKEFPEEMSKRTVINRHAKMFMNTSDDSDLLIESVNNTTRDEFETDALEIADNTAATMGNREPLMIDEPVQEPTTSPSSESAAPPPDGYSQIGMTAEVPF